MSVEQEVYNNKGSMCCRSWGHHRNPALRIKFGILLVTIGLIWLGARVGLLDLSWLHAAHFWPAVFIFLGTLAVYKGFMRRKSETINKERKEV